MQVNILLGGRDITHKQLVHGRSRQRCGETRTRESRPLNHESDVLPIDRVQPCTYWRSLRYVLKRMKGEILERARSLLRRYSLLPGRATAANQSCASNPHATELPATVRHFIAIVFRQLNWWRKFH